MIDELFAPISLLLRRHRRRSQPPFAFKTTQSNSITAAFTKALPVILMN
jgi:hypothetical protein